MKYKLLALDLDGTLTNSDKIITQKTIKAISDASLRGIKVVLASGRPVLGIEKLAQNLDLYNKGGFILANNGSLILDCGKKQVIYKKLIEIEHYKNIYALAKKYKAEPLTYISRGLVAETDEDRYVKQEAYNNSTTIKVVPYLLDEVDEEVTKFMIVGKPEILAEALPEVQKTFEGKLSVFLSEPYFMEIVPLGIEKSSALRFISNYIGCDRAETVAMGDGLNDLPMMRFAGFSIAMANAYDEVKKEADFITLSNNEDGVAFAIEKFLLN